jgi:hypothetical protein
MNEGTITMLVEVPRRTEAEMVALDVAERVATWPAADRGTCEGPTDVSFDVKASSDAEGRRLVRSAYGSLPPGAFKASTAR